MGSPEWSDNRTENSPAQAILKDNLDETDYLIAKALNDDGRMSDTELAERVGLSRTAARRRRKNLQDDGLLEILAVIVLQEADLAHADVRVTFDPDVSQFERDTLVRRLIDQELIYSIDSCMGDYDLFIRVWNTSLNAIKTYLWVLFEGEDAVAEYQATPVVKTWKAWDKTLDQPDVE